MNRCLTLLGLLSRSMTLFAEDNARTSPREAGDMKVHYNGNDLVGFEGDLRLWKVKNGVLHGETTMENPAWGNTFLFWRDGTAALVRLRR